MDRWWRLVAGESPNRTQRAIAAFVVLAMIYVVIVIWPRRLILAAMVQQHDELDAQATAQRAALRQLAAHDESPGASAVPQVDAILHAVPVSDDSGDLLWDLTQQAYAAGMTVDKIQRRPDQRGNDYEVVSFLFSLQGTYAQLSAFLLSLDRMVRIVDVAALTVRASDEAASASLIVPIEATCELRAYRAVPMLAAAAKPQVKVK